MSESYVVITGARGEIGHSLIERLADEGKKIIAVDLHPLSESEQKKCSNVIVGDILDDNVIEQVGRYNIDEIYHLAALLSTSAEKNPELAHRVNVNGTMNLLQMAYRVGKQNDKAVRFLFPSTIAVYGLPSLEDKIAAGPLKEDEHLKPMTMYGVNKLYCEHLGRYFSDLYRRLSAETEFGYVDFRALRFPGLISAFTVPSGGTSDYGPEMIHAAAKGESYACFVRADTKIPFMAMPDGVRALMELAQAPLDSLSRRVYNIGAFATTAAEFRSATLQEFSSVNITFSPDVKRQGIVDSWCVDVDDSAARNDWNWQPKFSFERAMSEYILPNIKKRYMS